jgi:DNA-binding transcriptional ArsR family regulator
MIYRCFQNAHQNAHCPFAARLRGFARSAIFNHPVDDCRALPHLARMTDPLDAIFAALSDPTRRAILAMLLEDDMAVTDVAAPFATSLAAISKHLTVLAEAGLISQEKRGRVKWCKLEPDAMRAASVWMQGFGQFEPVNLDAFERFLHLELQDTEEPPFPA